MLSSSVVECRATRTGNTRSSGTRLRCIFFPTSTRVRRQNLRVVWTSSKTETDEVMQSHFDHHNRNVPEPSQQPQHSLPRYTCSECGRHYATSSNLSRHKQTHRSLTGQHARTCPHCDKPYVSMPALAMHLLTHDLK